MPTSSHPDWTDTDELILASLASGMTHAEAARVADVSTKTVQRRVADNDFSDEVARRRREQVEQVTGQLTRLSVRAAETLELALDDDAASIRLKAVDLTFSWLIRLRREADLEQRIAEIEQELADEGGGRS
jgi:hypothetical protein